VHFPATHLPGLEPLPYVITPNPNELFTTQLTSFRGLTALLLLVSGHREGGSSVFGEGRWGGSA
jgi:hypothetical protein